MSRLRNLWRGEEGQDLTEYVLLLAFFALTATGLVVGPMVSVNKIWVYGNSQLSSAVTTANS
jgi:Flp pilus assembly pilin Flp